MRRAGEACTPWLALAAYVARLSMPQLQHVAPFGLALVVIMWLRYGGMQAAWIAAMLVLGVVSRNCRHVYKHWITKCRGCPGCPLCTDVVELCLATSTTQPS